MKKSGFSRFAQGHACAVAAVIIGMSLVKSVLGQVSIVPSGEGTQANPYQISQLGNLVWMGENVGSSDGRHYKLMNDIDASSTAGWNSGAGFVPIGSADDMGVPIAPFMGTFDGNLKVITGLMIARSTEDSVGFFGCVGSNGVVRHLGLMGLSVRCFDELLLEGTDQVGGLVACNYGTVTGCYAAGEVTGDYNVGGLVGYNVGTVSASYATSVMMGSSCIGGLVGYNIGTVSANYATGPGTGVVDAVGGLVGYNNGGMVRECYATGAVGGPS